MHFYYGTNPPASAEAVAKAFYEGRKLKRSNVETDGEHYIVNGNCIAQRIDVPLRVARKLTGELHPQAEGPWKGSHRDPDTWDFPTVRISWCGWDTWMTARHLRALGFDATPSRYGEPAQIDGKEVPTSDWITKEEIEALPKWVKPVKKPRERFVNLTAPLFTKDEAPEPRGFIHHGEFIAA